MKRLLVLGGPILQKFVIEKAKKMGLYVGVVDINANAPAAEFSDEFFIGSIKDKEAMMKVALSFKPDAIMSGACDTSVNTVAWLCKKLNLSGITEECAIKSTDKVEMLNAFVLAGVACPSYQVVKKKEIGSFVPSLPYPFIAKPTDSAGGRGVNLITNNSELKDLIKSSSSSGASGDVLLEECLQGPEVSVEILVVDSVPYVIQMTDKLTSGAPHFFEIGHVQPSSLTKEHQEQIAMLAKDAVRAVGIQSGASHVEIILTKDGPKMIELGARLGGDCITSLLIDRSISGLDMTSMAIRLALGNSVKIPDYCNSGKYAAIKFLPSAEGVLKKINGSEEAEGIPGVMHVEVVGEVGQQYQSAVDDSSRFAFAVALGDSQQKALEKCNRALGMLNVEVGK